MKRIEVEFVNDSKNQLYPRWLYGQSVLLSMICLLFFTGCSFDETIAVRNHDSGNEDLKLITFNVHGKEPVASKSSGTRAEMIEYDTFITQDIALTATFTGNGTNGTGDYFFSERMAFNNGWVTDNKYYWPREQLHFRARMPYTDNAVSNETNQGFTYTVPENAYDQHDMLYASTFNVDREDSVDIYFLHSMASVSFKAYKKDASVNGVVSGITIESVPRAATFLYPTEITTDQTDSPVCTWNVIEWGPVQAGIYETELTPDETTITDIGGELLLLPGTINSRLKISCRISDTGLYLAGSDHTFGTIYTPFSGITLEAGKHYTFVLEFGVGQDENGNVNQLKVTMGYYITPWGKEVINFDKQLL